MNLSTIVRLALFLLYVNEIHSFCCDGIKRPTANAFRIHSVAECCSMCSMSKASLQEEKQPPLIWKSIMARRSILKQLPIISAVVATTATATVQPAQAKTKPTASSNPNEDLQTIVDAAETLEKLLSNWDKATIDCTYADVPRELLEQKNKELLLEKASTFALFDKSTSVVSCKKTNKIVRDYIGVTGKGPLVNVDRKMLKRNVVDAYVDPDFLDEYYVQVENFQSAISRASSLSYAASTDFDSVNNFEKGEKENSKKEKDGSDSGALEQSKSLSDNSNLEQARRAISEAKDSIDVIVSILVAEPLS